jgi:hypothetical protein
MTEPQTIQSAFEPTTHLINWVVQLAPRALMFTLVLSVGALLSVLAGRLMRWGVERFKLDAMAERLGVARLLYAVGLRASLAIVLGRIITGIGLLVTAHNLAAIVGLPGLSEVLGAIMARLPAALAAVSVLIGGLLVAEALRRILDRLLQRQNDLQQPALIAQAVYYVCVVLSVTMATEQLGLQVALIHNMILIMVGALSCGAALAFALSSRHVLSQIVAKHHVKQLYRVGDSVELDAINGVIASFSAVCVCLKTPDGHINVPYQRFIEAPVAHVRNTPAAKKTASAETT